MTEADVIQPSASTASTGKGIRYIGQHCYAISGATDIDSLATFLEFTSGAGYIVGIFQVSGDSDNAGATFVTVTVTYNDETIFLSKERRDLGQMNDWPVNLIIPPETNVKITGRCGAGAETNFTATLTGRVYGAT